MPLREKGAMFRDAHSVAKPVTGETDRCKSKSDSHSYLEMGSFPLGRARSMPTSL